MAPRPSQKQVTDNWYSAYIKGNRARKKRDHWQVQELGFEGLTGFPRANSKCANQARFCFESSSDSKPSHTEKDCGSRATPRALVTLQKVGDIKHLVMFVCLLVCQARGADLSSQGS